MQEFIKLRLTYINYILYNYINKGIWKTTDFHKQLKLDLKGCKHKFKPIYHIALLCHNPITSSIYLTIIKSYIKLKNGFKK